MFVRNQVICVMSAILPSSNPISPPDADNLLVNSGASSTVPSAWEETLVPTVPTQPAQLTQPPSTFTDNFPTSAQSSSSHHGVLHALQRIAHIVQSGHHSTEQSGQDNRPGAVVVLHFPPSTTVSTSVSPDVDSEIKPSTSSQQSGISQSSANSIGSVNVAIFDAHESNFVVVLIVSCRILVDLNTCR